VKQQQHDAPQNYGMPAPHQCVPFKIFNPELFFTFGNFGSFFVLRVRDPAFSVPAYVPPPAVSNYGGEASSAFPSSSTTQVNAHTFCQWRLLFNDALIRRAFTVDRRLHFLHPPVQFPSGSQIQQLN
jgi:hypothetical protein